MSKARSLVSVSQLQKRKYPVYRNDIKFKKLRDIDPEFAIWADKDVEKDFKEMDTDSLEYRIKICRMEKYNVMDLSRLDPEIIEAFFECSFYDRHKSDIIHMFMNHSNISSLPSLRDMTSLETLDVSGNYLRELPEMPDSLTELLVPGNLLRSINVRLPHILRLNVSDNQITKIPELNSVRRLYIENNDVSSLNCSYPRLRDFRCSKNPISQLPEMDKLEYLECSKTGVHRIFDYMQLKHIVCNDSHIDKIERVPRIETLEIIRTKIKNLKYFPNLKTLLFNKESDIEISGRYKVKSAVSTKKNIFEVRFH